MKVRAMIFIILGIVVSLIGLSTASSQPESSADRTLSPYFFVQSEDASVDQLPLKSTMADVQIAGVIADVRVAQVYKNEGKTPLEAIYVFPASTRAAVYGMKMQIGKRTIEAKIKEREQARKDYEDAKNQGKNASLLEQQRPNVFQMNVANIMPGDVILVELKYTELLVPEDRVYEFVYPTVVGPRYTNQDAATAPASEHWIQNPYLRQGDAPTYDFDIHVNLATGMPIRDLACPSHKVDAVYADASRVAVELAAGEKTGGNRDYILRYRLDGDRIQSGLLLHEGEKENYFLLMMQPPQRIASGDIPGREYIFIVDVSGSMHGFPLDISKKLMSDLIGSLRPADRFNVLLFAGGSSLLAEESLPATTDNIRRAISHIENQTVGGGTEILPALKRVLALKHGKNTSRTLIVVTDGYVTVEEEVFDLIRKNLGQANLFAFGIGSSVNRHIIEGMARCGQGEAFVVVNPGEATEKAARFRKMIQSPVLSQVKVDFNGFETYDAEPLTLPDVLAERPVVVFGKWRGKAAGIITLKGMTGRGPYSESIEVGKAKATKEHSALRYLWARQRITLLSDYNNLRTDEKRIREITALGLTYNLLTAYTSFVAVDTEVRNNGQTTTVKQPLPLPQGVSEYAVGGSMVKGCAAPMPTLMESAFSGDWAVRARKKKDEREKRNSTTHGTLKSLQVSAGMSKKDIEKTVRCLLPKVDRCVGGTHLQGVLELRLSLNVGGTVKRVEVTAPDLLNDDMKSCLIAEVRKWHFPIPPKGVKARITILIDLA
ncbi:MAG TPA: VIT domain-containing protein [Syntrophales bacterium]|nr:VIT domain-containing protein [Syntrophales bacterium]